MKIRVINLGLPHSPSVNDVCSAGTKLATCRQSFSEAGYDVQSLRLSLSGEQCEELNGRALKDYLCRLNDTAAEAGISYCSLGVMRPSKTLDDTIELLPQFKHLNLCIETASPAVGIREEGVRLAAKAILKLSKAADPFTNFRLGAGSNLVPHIPYFPGSFHDGNESAISIGLENSDVMVETFRTSGADQSLKNVAEQFTTALMSHLSHIEKLALSCTSSLGVRYAGIDTSLAPSKARGESIVDAFEQLGVTFGAPGTLSICSMVTDVLKNLPVKKVGYCGIMMPILEDYGLARYSSSPNFNLTQFLAYCSVCGVGIDMVPIANAELSSLENLIRDVATLSVKLKKPLLVRLLPLPDVPAGHLTTFQSSYVVNATAVELR